MAPTTEIIEHLHNLKPTLDKNGRWLFVENARCGTASIGMALRDTAVRYRDVPEDTWQEVWKAIEWDRCVCFTSVRNTWDRIVSAWCYLVRCRDVDADAPFSEFVDRIYKEGPTFNRHVLPQIGSVSHDGQIPGMNVLRFSDLSLGWKYFSLNLGCHRQLEYLNKTQHLDYWQYYTKKSRDKIREIYQDEIELLKFRFGD